MREQGGSMRDILTVGGVSSADYGIYVLDVNDGDLPERDYEAISVPGRSRDLHYDNGRYFNLDRKYRCFAKRDYSDTVTDKITTFIAEIMRLKGYQRIECSLHSDHYILGEFRGGTSLEYSATKSGAVFELTFDCDARKWLKIGEREISLSGTMSVLNVGTQDAHPVFIVTGNGTITIGSFVITVANNPGTMIIDCEIGDAYDSVAHLNYNRYVTFSSHDLPYLPPGTNNIAVTGFSSCKMIPRWSTL